MVSCNSKTEKTGTRTEIRNKYGYLEVVTLESVLYIRAMFI